MVRRILLGTVGAMAMASSGLCADISAAYKDGGYPAPYNWGGFYGGANAGYAWTFNNLLNTEVSNVYSQADLSGEGAFAGLQAGYNWQRDRFVYGLEVDIQGTDMTGSTATSTPATPASPNLSENASLKSTTDWFGTVR